MIERTCIKCSKTFMARAYAVGRYCSLECRRDPVKLCEFCGVNRITPRNSVRFCSVECYHKERKASWGVQKCHYCGGEFVRRKTGKSFCSISCYRKSTKAPVAIVAPDIAIRETADERDTVRAIVREMYPTFTPISDITDRVNALGAKSYSPGAINKIASKLGVRRPEGFDYFNSHRNPRTPRIKAPKAPRVYRQKPKPVAKTPPVPTGPRPHPIQFTRQLYQHAFELRERYGVSLPRNLEPAEMTKALSRAWQKIEPDHPGFRLKQQANIMTDFSKMKGARST